MKPFRKLALAHFHGLTGRCESSRRRKMNCRDSPPPSGEHRKPIKVWAISSCFLAQDVKDWAGDARIDFDFRDPERSSFSPLSAQKYFNVDTQLSSLYPSLWPFRADSRWGHGHRSLARTKMSVWDFNYKSLILHQHSVLTHQSTRLISDFSVQACFLGLLKSVKTSGSLSSGPAHVRLAQPDFTAEFVWTGLNLSHLSGTETNYFPPLTSILLHSKPQLGECKKKQPTLNWAGGEMVP